MPIYDSSFLTQRRANKTIARDFINRINGQNITSYGPLQGNFDSSILNNVSEGRQQNITKCNGGYQVDNGGGCPCISETTNINNIIPPQRGDRIKAQWATYIDSSDNDDITSIATDSNNNIYITGQYKSSTLLVLKNADGTSQINSTVTLPATSNNNMFLIKYNPLGQVQWATILSIGNILSNGASLVIDSNDNIYVCGNYRTTESTIILKNANGNGQTDSTVTLPGGDGPFLFAGFLVSYNSLGQVQWATYINTSTNEPYYGAYSICISNNSIYMTGVYGFSSNIILKSASGNGQVNSSITLPSTNIDTLTSYIVKYTLSGTVVWATYLYNTPNSAQYNKTNSISFDSNNNIYVTGFYRINNQIVLQNANGNGQDASNVTLPVTSNYNMFLVCYNSSGQVQWATSFNTSGFSSGQSLIIDSSNNIYITGDYISSSIISLKNASGNDQVNSSITLPSRPSSSMFLMKYNSSGTALFATYLNCNSAGVGVTLDSSNNLYVTGSYTSSNVVLLKNANGNSQIDSTFTLPISPNYNVFVILYNEFGIAQSATFVKGEYLYLVTSGYITINSLNNVYVAAQYSLSVQTNLYNSLGNSQVESEITLPASSFIAGALIKYS
jgi:hypothetical protein